MSNNLIIKYEKDFVRACSEHAEILADQGSVDCIFSIGNKIVRVISFDPETNIEVLRDENARLKKEIAEIKQKEHIRVQMECHRGND